MSRDFQASNVMHILKHSFLSSMWMEQENSRLLQELDSAYNEVRSNHQPAECDHLYNSI